MEGFLEPPDTIASLARIGSSYKPTRFSVAHDSVAIARDRPTFRRPRVYPSSSLLGCAAAMRSTIRFGSRRRAIAKEQHRSRAIHARRQTAQRLAEQPTLARPARGASICVFLLGWFERRD